MATLNEESATYFLQDLSQVHRKLMTSLSHVADVLVSEINDSGIDNRKQQALQSAAVDLAMAIENIRTLKKMRDKIISDESAGILSFSRFFEELGIEIERAKRTRSSLGLLLLEFDLRASQLGKPLGAKANQYIEETAQSLKTVCRKSDLLGRSANTGFFLGLVGADLQKSSAVAEKIDEILKEHPLYRVCRVDHAIGVAVWPLDGTERDDLIFVAQQLVRTTRQGSARAIRIQGVEKR